MSALREIEDAVPALRRYAWSLLRHRQDADDLVQDTLVRALDFLPRRTHDTAMQPWLFAILHNLFVSRWRAARRRMTVFTTQDAAETDSPVPPTQDWNLAAQDLVRGLDRLPPEQRQVMLLVVVEGLGYQEVATVLGIPIGTVMSRLSRGRDALRGHMDGSKEGQVAPRLRRVK
jgi:RNA polymerase sigma-70 factor (ECF subfamily)